MKYMKRANIYQCSNYNCTFNANKCEAWSYRWWQFVKVIEGKVIFNHYNYSNSTSKHQSKVLQLMNDLCISVGMFVKLREGLQNIDTLADLYLREEEAQCIAFLEEEVKREERNEKAKKRRLKKKLEAHLENDCHFRDYDIADAEDFANPNSFISRKIAVHQIVERESLEDDVQNAIYNFQRDGFGSIVFYIQA